MSHRPTLKRGNTYFSFFYVDEDLRIPLIDTLVYLGETTLDETGERVHLFQFAESYYSDGNWNEMTPEQQAEYDEPPVTFFDEASLDPVVDAEGLVERIHVWKGRLK